MDVSVLLCLLKNKHTQIQSYFQSSCPPVSVTQFRLNGQHYVWGKVSDEVRIRIVFFSSFF